MRGDRAAGGKLTRLLRVWHHRPEWVRRCVDCAQWVMNGKGEFTLTQAGDRIPLPGPPPCWQCPKHPADAPPETKVPLPEEDDFGGWFSDLQDWYDEGRACGWPADMHGTLRQVVTVFDQAERAVERDERRRLIQLLTKRADR